MPEVAKAPLRGDLPSFLPAPLREPRSAWRSVLVGWMLTFPLSILLSATAQKLFPAAPEPQFGATGGLAIFSLVAFAPVVETMIMTGVLEGLRRLMSPVGAVLVSSLLWGLAHSVMAPTWGLIIWWPFLIFSILYLAWRPRGFWPAVAVAAATHALHNLGPALLVAFGR